MEAPRLFTAETLFQQLEQLSKEEREVMAVRFYDPAIDHDMAFDGAEIEEDRIVFYWHQG